MVVGRSAPVACAGRRSAEFGQFETFDFNQRIVDNRAERPALATLHPSCRQVSHLPMKQTTVEKVFAPSQQEVT